MKLIDKFLLFDYITLFHNFTNYKDDYVVSVEELLEKDPEELHLSNTFLNNLHLSIVVDRKDTVLLCKLQLMLQQLLHFLVTVHFWERVIIRDHVALVVEQNELVVEYLFYDFKVLQ